MNSELNWMDPEHRGYLVLDFSEMIKWKLGSILFQSYKRLDSTIASTKIFKVLKNKLKINTKKL